MVLLRNNQHSVIFNNMNNNKEIEPDDITILKYGDDTPGLANPTIGDDGLTAIFDYSEGWFRGYFKNGNLRYKWEYIEGKRADGISRSWYENGQIKKEISWKDGRETGPFIEWYENGQKKRELQNQVRGKQNGTHLCWYENGTLSQKGFFVDGEKEGLYVWYNEDGTIQSEEIWKSGELISKT